MNAMIFRTGATLGTAVLLAVSGSVTSASAAGKFRVLTYLVKQDFSDCLNANVDPHAPKPSIGGEAMVTRNDGNQTEVNVRLVRGTPNTTYNLFLKCHYQLGAIKTDSSGRGNNTFLFKTTDAGDVYAFDMYPDGAPLGNKYQSVQISFK